MKSTTKEVIYWTPRLICILFASFMFLFAFDVFNEDEGFIETIINLLLQLLPVFILILLLLISWRIVWIGAIVFNALGIGYILFNWGEFPFVSYLGVAGPMFIVGIFFLLNFIYKDEINDR